MAAENSGKALNPSVLEEDPRSTLWVWAAALALAVLLHSLVLWLKTPWNLSPPAPRVDIQPIDPAQLDRIRQQWKKKQLLLGKKDAKSETEAPKDARYFSDKNTKIEKEQRANMTNVIPKPGGIPRPGEDEREQGKKSGRTSKLSNLGINMGLDRVAERSAAPKRQAIPEGGDQALEDKSLPQGSENLLNTEQSVYYSFYSRLYESIGPIWQSRVRRAEVGRRLSPGDYITVVDVIFDAEGNLVTIKYLQSSSVAGFDSAVESSWRKIQRFPNPPRDKLDQNGHVHTLWTFTVSVGSGVGIQYLAPEWTN